MKSLAIISLILCTLSASALRAEVSYVRDLSFPPWPPLSPVMALPKAPLDTSDPLYNPALPDTQWIGTEGSYSTFDPATGTVASPVPFPAASIKINPYSLMALSGVGTSQPILNILGFRNVLYRYNLATNLLEPSDSEGVQVLLFSVSSLAAPNRTSLTAIGDFIDPWGLYSINMDTGETTQEFAFTGGSEPGHFSLDTFYHVYGPDGLVYLLDYGNDRMQTLDPANGFAYVGGFAFDPEITANMQFAIGPTGNIYLGDGEGGGSSYDATGAFLGSFTLPPSVTGDAFVGTPYVSTDQSGHVYVFDDTGFHQYLDASVVPEPSVTTLLIGGSILAFALARRRIRKV